MKILILKPSSLGDVVQALPVLRAIKQHLPTAKVWWWIDLDLAPLLEHDPALEGVFPFPKRRWNSPFRWPEILTFIRRLRREKFDWVIDLQSLARSGSVAWLANGALTVGLDDSREGARGFYDLAVRRPSPTTHAIDWYLEVPRTLGIPLQPDFHWLPSQPRVADDVENRWHPSHHQWVALQPSARWQTKRWPAGHFKELVRLLALARPDLHFVVLGSAADHTLSASVLASTPERGLNLAGVTTLPQLVEWLRCCKLLVTNDTGPMHIAAALKLPVIALFGPTDPRRTGPYGQHDAVFRNPAIPCVPCMSNRCRFSRPLECLQSISPQQVADAVLTRLRASA